MPSQLQCVVSGAPAAVGGGHQPRRASTGCLRRVLDPACVIYYSLCWELFPAVHVAYSTEIAAPPPEKGEACFLLKIILKNNRLNRE